MGGFIQYNNPSKKYEYIYIIISIVIFIIYYYILYIYYHIISYHILYYIYDILILHTYIYIHGIMWSSNSGSLFVDFYPGHVIFNIFNNHRFRVIRIFKSIIGYLISRHNRHSKNRELSVDSPDTRTWMTLSGGLNSQWVSDGLSHICISNIMEIIQSCLKPPTRMTRMMIDDDRWW